MPHDPKPTTGSFSDLYEAMQTRPTPRPAAAPTLPPVASTPRNRGKAEPLNRASAEPKIRGTAEPRAGMGTSSTLAKPGGLDIAEKPYKPHGFLWTKEEAVIQGHSIGPWGITYANPSDDPRTKK